MKKEQANKERPELRDDADGERTIMNESTSIRPHKKLDLNRILFKESELTAPFYFAHI